MEKLNVVALFGGQSSEHVVSCMSVQNVAANINKEKYNVILVGITEEGRWLKVDSLDEVKNDTWRTSGSRAVLSPDATEKVLWVIRHGKAEKIPVDVVFPVLHGLYGEDGTVQGILELAQIPYVGCGVLASAACMDKAVANTIMDAYHVPHCHWCSAVRAEAETQRSTLLTRVENRLPYPIFVKPANAGSSVGITKAHNREELNTAIDTALREDDKVVFEEFIDGQEVESGTDSDKEINRSLKAGTYNLKIEVETVKGKKTSREGLVVVNPLADDPQSKEVAFERIVSPGKTARLYGSNLQNVTAILLGGNTITDPTYVESEDENYLEYIVPTGVSEGDYRIVLQDAAGNEYGADMVKVTNASLVISGANRATANVDWTISGINLENIASLTIGGQTVSQFSNQSSTEVTLTCPDLSDGSYTMTGKTRSGEAVQFLNDNVTTTEQTVTVSTEITLWSGHHYVSWDKPDGDPNKTFGLIPMDVFAGITAGSTLKVVYSIEPTAEYHQMRLATGNWSYFTDPINFSENGEYALTLTQDMLNMIQAENGFICVGHGYYVDLVTVK